MPDCVPSQCTNLSSLWFAIQVCSTNFQSPVFLQYRPPDHIDIPASNPGLAPTNDRAKPCRHILASSHKRNCLLFYRTHIATTTSHPDRGSLIGEARERHRSCEFLKREKR